MPFQPNVSYHGDQYLYQGISNLGNLFSDELKKYMELKKQGDTNDAIIQHAAAAGRITPEGYNTYIQANWTKKQGIANGIIANIADDWQRQMFSEKQDKSAELANALAVANIHAGSAEKVAQMNIDAGKYAGSGGDEPMQIDPLTDPTSQQPVPGMGVVRKTGAVVSTAGPSTAPILDPSKKFYSTDAGRSWKPLNSKLARQIEDAATGDAPMNPPPSGFSLLHPSTWLGGGGSPAPAAASTALAPIDFPAAQGVRPGPAYPPEPALRAAMPAPSVPSVYVNATAARAQAKAKIDAGADRDAIIARLKQLGVDSSGL